MANAAILRLHTASLWAKVSGEREALADSQEMKNAKPNMRTGEFNEFDLALRAEMDELIAECYRHFEK